jgi:hypothetical protein
MGRRWALQQNVWEEGVELASEVIVPPYSSIVLANGISKRQQI